MDPNYTNFRHSHSAVVDGGFVDVLVVRVCVCRQFYRSDVFTR
jgi:hypothetical protein